MRGTWKRTLGAYLLALCLCLTLLPAAALAADSNPVGGEDTPLTSGGDEQQDGGTLDPTNPPEQGVSYIKYTWNDGYLDEKQESTSTYTEINPTSELPTIWGVANTATWYVATGEVAIGSEEKPARVTVTGTVNLILTDGCTLTVYGGIQVAEDSTLTIYGQSGRSNQGQLIATAAAGSGNAGIGGNANESCGAITIHGGRVTATGGAGAGSTDTGDSRTGDSGSTGGGAGIGAGANGDMSTSASITISGKANVTATAGGDGAAIGTGAGGDMSSDQTSHKSASITIQDKATVNATASGGGAAIGTGQDGAMQGKNAYKSEITITGAATVTATAEGTGAAIGSGQGTGSGGGGVITISSENETASPTVTATAQKGGAAIGSGAGADLYTEIRIFGPAEVTATAEGGGAAIGSGQGGNMTKSSGPAAGVIYIRNSEGKEKENEENTRLSPDITATVEDGAAAVIGCGENGSIGSASDIDIGGTAKITLCENNPTIVGYVPAPAIGAGGYPEGEEQTTVKGTITIQNSDEDGVVNTNGHHPALTLYGTGEIGPKSAVEHPNNYLVHDDVSITIKCMVTVTAGAGGAVSGGGEFKKGSAVTVTATPNSGYRFVHWTENGAEVSTAAAYTFSAAGNRVLTAEFAQLPAPSDDGGSSSGGSSSPTYRPDVEDAEHGDVTVTPSRPERGDDVTVTPEPDEGYEVDEVTVTDRNGNEVEVTDNGDGTWTFEQPRGRVTISVTFRELPPEPLPFTDVPEGYWAETAIRYVYENGLMAGTSETTFSPGDTLSRQQVWMILARMDGYTPEDMEAARGWAVSAGISDGSNPGDPVTRQQLAALLYRFLQRNGGGFTGAWAFPLDYPDAGSVSAYAYEALCWMTMRGVITGMADGTLNPQGTATRAQAAVMLERFCELNK